MSGDVDAVMRGIREVIENKRGLADNALREFADQVAADARQHAPVRKMYTSKKKSSKAVPGFTGPRSATRDPGIEEAEMLYGIAQRVNYKFLRDNGWRNEGTELNPIWKRSEPTEINEPAHGIRKQRRITSGVLSRNRAESKARILGTVIERRRVTNVVSTSAVLRKQPKSTLMRGPKPVARRERPVVTGQDVSFNVAFVRRKGVRIDMEVGRRLSHGKEGQRELYIKRINSVGKGLLRYMSAKQKYDVIHGRGIRFIPAGRGRSKVVMGGALRESIQAVEGDKSLQYFVEANIHYARYVELGTRYMAAQPYITPALINARKRMQSAIAHGVRG